MSLESLKTRRNNTQAIIDELNKFKTTKKVRSDNARFWSPKPDKQGNAHAIIRFLPALEADNLNVPFVKIWDHGFQGPTGKWYIENSLRTIGKDDPVSQSNHTLWESGLESNKETARKRKQRLHYITNIYVAKDTLHPENEGKVFLYKFGKKIFEKIESAMMPPKEFEEKPIIPYDLWEGANFKLRIKKGDGGWPNSQDSTFESVGPLFKTKKGEADEDKMTEVYDKVSSLLPFVDPDGVDSDGERYFKSFEELRDKLLSVIGENESENGSLSHTTSAVKNKSQVKPVDENDEDNSSEVVVEDVEDVEDDDVSLDYLSSLINDE